MAGTWELVAPSRGGTVTGLASASGLVFAATPVGIYRSKDAGSHWELPGSAPTVPLASAVALSPRFDTDKTLFASGADGLYRSSDIGETWERILSGEGMLSVATALSEHDSILLLTGTEADGVLRSEDAGRNWSGANAGLVDLTAICLAVSPCFSTDRTAFAGTASGLYRTRNGARSWRSVETGLDEPAVQCLLISPSFAEDRLVLAGTESHGLLRSADGGSTWHSPPTMATGGVTALAYGDGVIGAATENGIVLSQDGGQTWRIAEEGPREPALSLLFDGDGLLVGLHRSGMIRSRHAGAVWEPSSEGLSARLDTGLVVSSANTLYISGLEDGLRRSTDAGTSWEYVTVGESAPAIHGLAAPENRLWVATAEGLLVSADGALTLRPASSDSRPVRIVTAGYATILTALDGGVLLLSRDGGASWRELHTPGENSTIVALAVLSDRSLLAATSSAAEVTLWRWEDLHGWSRLLVERSNGAISRVALAASNTAQVDQGIFVGLGRRVLYPLRQTQEVRHRERRPMWRAVDLGPNVVNVTSLAVSPDGRAVLAATNAGVYVSRDGSETFTDWTDGLSNPRTVAVALSPSFAEDRTVYALALGGSLWRRTI